jgi:hypothetical protein
MFRFIAHTEKIFSEAGKKNETENFAHSKTICFLKNTTLFKLFIFFDRKKTFATAKK